MPLRRFSLFILATSASFAAFTVACSSSTDSGSTTGNGDGGTAATYTPYYTDFCNYTSWTRYEEADAGGDGIIAPSATSDGGFVHVGGERVEYINHPPPHGSKEFPVGTLIVKQIPAQDQVFAMAKVGGGYNPNLPDGGALNWEWIELPTGDCPPYFIWQGSFPPANQAYGGTPTVCNDCHGGFTDNDYVASPKILLKDY